MAVLAPALVCCRSEINYKWPHRDHRSDGWIGDLLHRLTRSDHNPNGRGVVDAIDIDVDGIVPALLVAILIRHPSVNYVIWNRKIWSRSNGFVAHAYTGHDPHTGHVHCSLMQSVAAENNLRPWGIASIVVVPVVLPIPGTGPIELAWAQRLAGALPVLRPAATARRSVRRAQALINVADGTAHLTEDGGFGPLTTAATKRFQRAYHLDDDGVIGAKTWAALVGALPTLRRGAKGVEVRRLQALLNVLGAGIREDGDLGGNTEAAVRNFQARYGLSRDGVAGPVTYTTLLSR